MRREEPAHTVVAGVWLSARQPRPPTASMLLSSSMLVKVVATEARARTVRSCSSRSRAVMGAVVTASTTAAAKARTAEAGAGTRARAGQQAMVAVVAVATTAAVVGVGTMPVSSNVAGAAATTVSFVANRLRRRATMGTRVAAMVNSSSSRAAMAANNRATAMANRAMASPRMVSSSSTASSRATAGARMPRRRHTIQAVARVVARVGTRMVAAAAAATAAAAVVVAGMWVAAGGGTATTRTGRHPRRGGAAPWRGRRRSCCGEVGDEVDVGGGISTLCSVFAAPYSACVCLLLSIGFEPLPRIVLSRSSLYRLPSSFRCGGVVRTRRVQMSRVFC